MLFNRNLQNVITINVRSCCKQVIQYKHVGTIICMMLKKVTKLCLLQVMWITHELFYSSPAFTD